MIGAYRRKTERGKYGVINLRTAIERFKKRDLSKRKIEKIYGIPRRTLTRHLRRPESEQGNIHLGRFKPTHHMDSENAMLDSGAFKNLVFNVGTKKLVEDKTLSSLDSEMKETLNSDVPEDDKVRRYLSALSKYWSYKDLKPIETARDFESRVVNSVPISQQYKARRLMDYLKRDPDVNWSDKGELIYRQSLIPNSYIVDIMSDFLKKNTVGENPLGQEQVLTSLSNQNIPQGLVTNAKKWRYIRGAKNVDDDDGEVPAPTSTRSSKKRARVQDSTTNRSLSTRRKTLKHQSRAIDWEKF